MKQRTTRLAPQRRSGRQTLKSALQRLSMTLMLVMLTAMTAWAETENLGGYEFTIGTDGEGSYYKVDCTAAFDAIATYVNAGNDANGKRFKQTANITYSHTTDWNNASSTENNFTAIGHQNHRFKGTYDGGGYTISGIRIYKGGTDATTEYNQGLFGHVQSGTVKNVILTDTRITGYKWVGGIVGTLQLGTVSNCRVGSNVAIHSVQSNAECHGGVVGQAGGSVTDCFSAATVTIVSKNTGAIAGYDMGSLQRNVYIYTTCYGIGSNNSTSSNDFTSYNAAVNASPNHFTDNGDNTYTIKTALGWDVFCGLLATEASGYFTGKTVKLDANIEVSRMAGDSGHPFTGTFNGQEHTLTVSYGSADNRISEQYAAPFRYVEGGTIQNLHVSGDIYTSVKYAAGIIAQQSGNTTISNCRSSVTINSSVSGDGTHGGLVALNNSSANLTITGCVFDGSLLGASTTCWGGFVGWRSGTVNVSNSLFAPASVTIDADDSYTFSRRSGTITNCYYTTALGTAQGKSPRTITAGANVTISHIALTGSTTAYDVSSITAYSNGGLVLDKGNAMMIYYGSGDEMSLTLGHSEGYTLDHYTASAGTLIGSENPYTLTMPDADVTISVGTLRSTREAVSVSYKNAKGKTNHIWAIALDGTEDCLEAGWYFVGTNISHSGQINCNGNVNIILCDGKTMTVNGGENGIYGNLYGAHDATLTIYGQTRGTGTLNTTGDEYGIWHQDNVVINGGNVTATAGNNGIDGTNVTINGGQVTAKGWYGIDGTNVTINGGKVTATSGEYGSGIKVYEGTITLGWTNADDFIKASSYDGTVNIADGYAFTDGGGNIYSGTLSSDDLTAIAGQTLQPVTAVSLADAADNTAIIAKCNGVTGIDITLQGRTLWKDGAWNTLCLPFDIADINAKEEEEYTCLLHDATVMELDVDDKWTMVDSHWQIDNEGAYQTGLVDGTLYLFFKNASAIEAGKPYIVRWGTPESNPGGTITNPEFTGVTVKSGMNDFESIDHKVEFKGTYNPMSWDEETPSILFVGADNSLHWPEEGASLGACRAYFQLAGGVSAREFVLNFGTGSEETSISPAEIKEIAESADAWYDLQGRKIANGQKPTAKGLYIVNGKKVVIK